MTVIIPRLATEFPIWYSEVSIDADEALRKRRIEGINYLTKTADQELVEGLVRLAFGIERHPASSSVLDVIHSGFREKDPSFDPSKSGRELEVLAGACLVGIFDSGKSVGDIAALSVATAYLGKGRKTNLPMDLAAIANQVLDQRSVDARIRPDLSDYGRVPTFKVGEDFSAPDEGEAAEAVDASDLSTLASEVNSALECIANRQSRMIGSLSQFIEVQDEELQVLWWFLGGRSRDLDCDFTKVPLSAKPLIFGKEMADETHILPGLRTVRSLMSRAGLKMSSKLSLADVVNGSPVDWLKELMNDSSPSPVTQPLHFAISRRLEVDDNESWVDGCAGTLGVKARQKFSLLDIGELFYREQLLRQFP